MMMSLPEEEEIYQSGEIELRALLFNDPPSTKYWIKGGVGLIEFSKQDLEDLQAILNDYLGHNRLLLWKYLFILTLLVLVVVTLVTYMGGNYGI